jgi:hypothetical protein
VPSRVVVVALALLLLAPGTASAQAPDAGLDPASGGFMNPTAYLLLQLYGLQAEQQASMPQADRDELARRAAEYFTNGAAVTGVPTSGPGATYFQNGAEVAAASTAQAIPFGMSAFPSAEGETDAAPGLAVPPAPSGSAQTALPAARAGISNGITDDAGPSARLEANPVEAPPAPPGPMPPAGSSAAAASPTGGVSSTQSTALAALADSTAGSTSIANRRVWGAAPMLGGIAVGALIVFLAVFLGARFRARRASST